MSRETQPLPVEPTPLVNSTALNTSPLRATGSVERNRPRHATGSQAAELTAFLKERAKQFDDSLPTADEDIAVRNQLVQESNSRPGRPVVIYDDGQICREMFVADEDWKAFTATRRKKSRQASQPRSKKPKLKPVAGTYWRADGDGYELRKSGGKDDPDKDKYLGRMSGKRYAQMKEEFGSQLPVALTEWVKQKAAEKGIQL